MQPSFLPGYQHHGIGLHPLLAADEAEPFGRGRLDRHTRNIHAQHAGQPPAHGIDVGTQPGTLHGDGHIGIHHTESFTGQQFHTPFQQHHAVYPGILRRRIRKMEPDIAQSGGTEQGIAQRMHGHVAVRMGHASPVVLQVDSAKPQAQPRREGMHVVTVPHPEAIGKSPIHNSQFEDCKLRIFSLFLHFLADGGKRLKSRNNILNDNQGAAQERAALRPEHSAARGRHRMPQGRKNAKAMSEISRLEPRAVWEIFDEITQVPRPSKKEEKIIAYLEGFARKHSLDYRKDTAGNIVMYKKATPSMAGKPTVVLQSHMDMVCEKTADVAIDFMPAPIQHYDDGEWVKARGTTLGADDGIGMATALALITAEGVEHPDLEALFTVDEETGLTGAFTLGSDMLSGRYLINLDSEDDGEIFIGCAGGVDTVATFRYREEPAPEGMTWMQADLSGLKGGHSGDNINDGLGNSNKLLTRLLLAGTERMGLRLASFDGGNLRNAIPREAHAVFGVPAGQADEMRRLTGQFAATFAEEYKYTDAGVRLEVREAGKPATVIDAGTQRSLLLALQGVANGVLAMSRSMPGLVETSTNLASVKFADGGRIVVTSSQRSSVESAKADAAATVGAAFRLAGAEVEHGEGYPGWNPDPSSRLLQIAEAAYEHLFGTQPKVRAIHAGLECGLFLEKYPKLEMISVGPTLRGVHSPDERLEISTVPKFWILLTEVLKTI